MQCASWQGRNLRKIILLFAFSAAAFQCCFKKLWKLYLNSFLGTRLMLICIVSDYTGCVTLFDRDNEL